MRGHEGRVMGQESQGISWQGTPHLDTINVLLVIIRVLGLLLLVAVVAKVLDPALLANSGDRLLLLVLPALGARAGLTASAAPATAAAPTPAPASGSAPAHPTQLSMQFGGKCEQLLHQTDLSGVP